MQILNGLNSGQPLAAFTGLVVRCHQIPSCHSDELGMTEQKLVFARVDRLTPIPTAAAAAAKQSNSSGICLVYYLSLNFWD
jgi:hypothetical protein